MSNAKKLGDYLITELKKFQNINEIRGRGLMIGIELPQEFAHVKSDLLYKHHIFTGEAKPNVIRLLPSLNVSINEVDMFLNAFKKLVG